MDSVRKMTLRSWPSLRRKSFGLERRTLQDTARQHAHYDRKYVRIAGPTAYATRDDIIDFMQRNGVDMSAVLEGKSRRLEAMYGPQGREDGRKGPSRTSESRGKPFVDPADMESDSKEVSAQSLATSDVVSDEITTRERATSGDGPSVGTMILDSSAAVNRVPLLAQSKSEAFMNISTWYYEAESPEDARDIASKLRGKVCGLKLIRAAAVDQRVVSEVPGFVMDPPKVDKKRGGPHFPKSIAGLIAPSNEERDRCLLVSGLRHMTYPRTVWGFFRGYDVAHVRMLRKPGIASVVFREVSDMERAFRERSNLKVHGHPDLRVSHHC